MIDINKAKVEYIKGKEGTVSDDGQIFTILLKYSGYDAESKEIATDILTKILLSNATLITRGGSHSFNSADALAQSLKEPHAIIQLKETKMDDSMVEVTRCNIFNCAN